MINTRNLIHVFAIFALSSISILSCVSNSANSFNDVKVDAVSELQKLGVRTENTSLQAIAFDRQRTHEERHWAALAVGQLKNEESLRILSAMLVEDDEETRLIALSGLRQMISPLTIPVLRSVIENDKSTAVKLGALDALWLTKDTKAHSYLTRTALNKQQPIDVQKSALSYLRSFKSEKPSYQLKSLIHSTDIEVKAMAALYLSEHYGEEMVPYLVMSVMEEDLPLWHWIDATERLEKMSGKEFITTSPTQLLDDPSARQDATNAVKKWSIDTGVME